MALSDRHVDELNQKHLCVTLDMVLRGPNGITRAWLNVNSMCMDYNSQQDSDGSRNFCILRKASKGNSWRNQEKDFL